MLLAFLLKASVGIYIFVIYLLHFSGENEHKKILFLQIWPACQLINFYFTPFLLRPLVVAVVGLLWNVYLAWKTNY
jgi:hypothetical protein